MKMSGILPYTWPCGMVHAIISDRKFMAQNLLLIIQWAFAYSRGNRLDWRSDSAETQWGARPSCQTRKNENANGLRWRVSRSKNELYHLRRNGEFFHTRQSNLDRNPIWLPQPLLKLHDHFSMIAKKIEWWHWHLVVTAYVFLVPRDVCLMDSPVPVLIVGKSSNKIK